MYAYWKGILRRPCILVGRGGLRCNGERGRRVESGSAPGVWSPLLWGGAWGEKAGYTVGIVLRRRGDARVLCIVRRGIVPGYISRALAWGGQGARYREPEHGHARSPEFPGGPESTPVGT